MRTEPANCGRFASIEGNDRSARVGLAMVQFLSGETANLSFARNWTAGVVVPGLYGLVRFLMPWVYYLVEAYPHAKARLSTAPPLFFPSPGVHMYHI